MKNILLTSVVRKIGTKLDITSNDEKFNCKIVEKPFYDLKKKIAST